MLDIYNYVPEINYVSMVYSAAAVLCLQFVLHAMIFRMFSMFCTFALVLSRMHVQCRMRLLFAVPFSCFPCMLLTYCPNDFEMVPLAPIITGLLLLLLLLLFLLLE